MMEIDSSVLTQFGLMNKIRTGHMFLDMLLVLLAPMLVAKCTVLLNELKNWLLKEKEVPEEKVYMRTILYYDFAGRYCYDSENSHCKTLQSAILMYLNSKPEVFERVREAQVKLRVHTQKEMEKAAAETTHKHVKEIDCNDSMGSDWLSEDSDGYDSENDGGRASELQRLQLQSIPPLDVFIEVEKGIMFKRASGKENDGEKDQGPPRTFTTFTLQSSEENGQHLITVFLQKAMAMYKKNMEAKKDTSRYLYTPMFCKNYLPKKNDNEEEKSMMMFKRYQLSEEKTFKSWFHPEKDSVVRLLDHFMKKKGKFAIPGYPHKLGLLLHGPPGTGKTSFIKALANYTRRHVISIPLERVETNQELTNLIFDQQCRVESDDYCYSLPFNKTIFVMEDVDAAADVVHKRKDDDEKSKGNQEPSLSPYLEYQHQRALAERLAMERKSSDSTESDGDKKKDKKKDGNKKCSSFSEIQPASPLGASSPMSFISAPNTTLADFGKIPSSWAKWNLTLDELNLAGILNVLDGVVDCPGRIVIMTTNHPEKLDPALIRPGRINKKLYLGYMTAEGAVQMATHYFSENITSVDKDRLREIFPEDKVTPAALESLCADCDTVGELVKLVEEKFVTGDD